MKIIFNNQTGSTLLAYTVIVFSAMLIVVLTMNSIVLNQLKISGLQSESTKAYFAAEAGAEAISYSLIKDGFDPDVGSCAAPAFVDVQTKSCGAQVNVALSNSAFFYIRKISDSPNLKFNCYGEFKNARRIIELSF